MTSPIPSPHEPATLPFRDGKLLRNSFFNLAGVILPAAVAVLATPVLLTQLGRSGFGILSIQLAVLTIIGINDFGLSRAMVLEAIAQGGFADRGRLATVMRASLQLTTALCVSVASIGLAAFLCMLALIPMSVDYAAAWLMLILSCVTSLFTLPLRASMEVQERFGLINVLRIIGTSSMFLAPALATAVLPTLTVAAGALLLSRMALLGIYALNTRGVFALLDKGPIVTLPSMYQGFRLPPLHSRLVKLGGWLGAAGLGSMLIGYSDRFALGFMSTAATVADYTVVSELVTKGWLVTGALISAATPRLAHSWTHASRSFHRDFLILAGMLGFVAMAGHVVLLFEGDRILRIWLQQNFQPDMVPILKILSVGIAVNALSVPNYLLMVLGGRERQAAYVQFVALPLTFLGSLAAARYFGPIGVAWIFAARLTLDVFVIRAMVPRTPDGHRTGVPTIAIVGWVIVTYGLLALTL